MTCGGGTKKRGREVIREAKDAGASCPDLEETDVCNTEECPGILSILLSDFLPHIFTKGGVAVQKPVKILALPGRG